MAKKKKGKSSLSFVILIILAIAISYGVYTYFSSQTTTLYVFKDYHAAGDLIVRDMFKEITVDKNITESVNKEREKESDPAFAGTESMKDLIGNYLSRDVQKGEIFMTHLASEYGSTPVQIRLDKNKVAVTVPVNSISMGSKYLEPGDSVIVTAGYEDASTGETKTDLVLQNLEVLDIIESSMGEGEVSGVTLEATPENAVLLNHFAEFGVVRLGEIKKGFYEEIEPVSVPRDSDLLIGN